MCGYVRRHIGPKTLNEFLELLGISGYYDESNNEPELKHYYPAFCGNPDRKIEGLIIEEEGQLKLVDATWWYECSEEDGEFKVGTRTTFNARNLESRYWKSAIRHHRAIVVATGLGEGKMIDGKNKHFLVTSDRLILLGAVYQRFPSGRYSCAIITRDTHPRFEPYHEKAFPLFLPYNLDFLKLWLSDADEQQPQIAHLLASPKIFANLSITPSKNV
ncbi:MAG: SOS response-associated peptidase family protein [Cellvibrio sp.]|nr:SOS response-associated peptidase family protein [Cellvibrio sp.]